MGCAATELSPIDWQRVVLDIRATGVPLAQLARRLNADDRTFQRLARGEVRTVEFGLGCRLLDAHLEHCPDRHDMEWIGR